MKLNILKRFSLLMMALMVTMTISAQSKIKVSGTVADQMGPLVGVSVVQKGTTNGSITDMDGRFSITVPKGSKLVFSYVGYAPQEVTADRATIDVTLHENAKDLDEVVVVGYGVQKKSDLTGAISQVKSQDMHNRTITSAESALQGKTAGVQVFSSSARPGAVPQVRVRGISSNGSSDPLYVIDGRIGNISTLDPEDIESMEVLKDGASAAIYGARAGNGVILVTTKKGKGNGKLTYSFQLASQSLSKVPHVMNSEQYMQYYMEQGTFAEDFFMTNWDYKTNTDWVDYTYENSLMTKHNLTFEGGSDKGNLYVSASVLNDNGMFAGDHDVYKRISGMVNGSWKLKPWLEITTNNQVAYTTTRTVSEGGDGSSAILNCLLMDPLTPTTYAEANLPSFMRDYITAGHNLIKDENGDFYSISAINPNGPLNPRLMRDNGNGKTTNFTLNGSTALNFKPYKDLTITSRLGYALSASDNNSYILNYYVNPNKNQNYIELNGAQGNSIYYQWENFANWMHSFGKHNVSAMVGTSYSQNRVTSMNGNTRGSDTDLGVLQNNPLFYYLSYATPAATKTVGGAEPIYNRNLSYFGRLSWNYASRYYLEASFRADAADLSILPKAQRWGYFPSVSAGWVVSEEAFWQNIKPYVPYMKIRASWGQNGSTASLGNYAWANVIQRSLGTFAATSYPVFQNGDDTKYTYIDSYEPSSTGNEQLKWETSEQTDLGIDLRFFNSRLSVSADWYKKKTKDLIVTGTVPSLLIGVSASPINAGNVENTGFELEASWRDNIGDFSYGISANMATLHNEVTYIHPSLKDGLAGTGYQSYGYITRFEKGYPAWHFYGYKYIGTDPETGNAKFADIDGDGSITDADRTDLGSGIPKLNYGLTLTAAWKGIDLLVFGTGTAGSKIFNCLTNPSSATNRLTYFTDDRWTPEHTNGTMPAASAANWQQFVTSSGVVFSGNYFKIKQIQLGYTFPKSLTQKIKIENLRIYTSLDDWFTITDYPGFDPEVNGIGNSLGVDKGSFPNAKKFVLGLNLTF